MADLINLRMARKRAKRALKEQEAEQNRARFGQSKTASRLIRSQKEHHDRALDGHKMDETDTKGTN